MNNEITLHDSFAFEAALMRMIGENARRLRIARKLTQADVADAIGLSAEYYARVERGRTMPSIETLHRMVLWLGGSADTFLGWTEHGDSTPSADAESGSAALALEAELQPLRRVLRQLRRASPRARAFVDHVLGEMEYMAGGQTEKNR
jgi:transcriptional regulator with XRE-family HTH domain